MRSPDQSPGLSRRLPALAHTGQVRCLCLLQRIDVPLPPRLPIQYITIFELAPIAEAAVIEGRNSQVLAGIDGPKEAFLEMYAKTTVPPDGRDEEPRAPFGKRIRQRGNRNHRDIVHAEPCTRESHVVAGTQVKVLELEPPGRCLTLLRIAVRKPALFHPIMVL